MFVWLFVSVGADEALTVCVIEADCDAVDDTEGVALAVGEGVDVPDDVCDSEPVLDWLCEADADSLRV